MAQFNLEQPITLNQTEDGSEVVAAVTGTAASNYDFIVLVDVSVVRDGTPGTVEHYFTAKKYTAGTWPVTGDTFNIAVTPLLGDDDTVSAKAFASYVTTVTTP